VTNAAKQYRRGLVNLIFHFTFTMWIGS
jgi:hypothetical protein